MARALSLLAFIFAAAGCQPYLIDEYELSRPLERNDVGLGLIGVRARWDLDLNAPVVTWVFEGAPAAGVGVAVGDRLVSFAGVVPSSLDQIETLVERAPLVSRQHVVFRRGADERAVDIPIMDRGDFLRRFAARVAESVTQRNKTELWFPLLFSYLDLSLDRRIAYEYCGREFASDISVYTDLRIFDFLIFELFRVESCSLFGGWRVTLITWPLCITRRGEVPEPSPDADRLL